MNYYNCDLNITVVRRDVTFMLHTIPHLVKACDYPFARRTLILDHAPSDSKSSRWSGEGDLRELRDCCSKLLRDGIIDEVVDIDYSESRRKQIYNKYFGEDIKRTHCSRGTSIYGYIFSIEESQADYFVHFDSDMLLHQRRDFHWIDHGIKLLLKRPEIMVVTPLSGPPADGGILYQRTPYQYHSHGFYQFQAFTSRVFLIERKRFDRLSPLLPLGIAANDNLPAWEEMVTANIKKMSYIRAEIGLPNAWTLHPRNHGDEVVTALPNIIERIEAGWYPPEQAGHYDLRLSVWMRHLGLMRKYAYAHSVEQITHEHVRNALRNRLERNPFGNACLKICVTGEGGGEWLFDLSRPELTLANKDLPADCTITTSVNILMNLIDEEFDLDIAVNLGWLRIDGNVELFNYLFRNWLFENSRETP